MSQISFIFLIDEEDSTMLKNNPKNIWFLLDLLQCQDARLDTKLATVQQHHKPQPLGSTGQPLFVFC